MRETVLVFCLVLVSLVSAQSLNVTLDWTSCPLSRTGATSQQAQCATFPTHADYVTLTGEVTIAVKRLPGNSNNQLWLVSDGPGLSGAMFEAIAENFYNDLGQEFSVYIMDHRGTGDSSPLNCPSSQGVEPPEGDCIVFLEDTFENQLKYFNTYNIARDYATLQQLLPSDNTTLIFYYGIGFGSYVIDQIEGVSEVQADAIVMDGYRYPSLVDYDASAQSVGLSFIDGCSEVRDCQSKLQKRDPEELFAQIFLEFDGLDCPSALGLSDRDVRTGFRNMLKDQNLRNLLIPVAVRFLRCNSDDLTYLQTGFVGLVDKFYQDSTAAFVDGESYVSRNNIDINEFFPTSDGIPPVTAGITAESDEYYFSNYYSTYISVLSQTWSWKYNPEINPYAFSRIKSAMLMMAAEYDAVESPQFIALAGQVYHSKKQRAIQMPYSAHGVLFNSPVTYNGPTCGYNATIQFFTQTPGNFSAHDIQFDCAQDLAPPDYAAAEASTISLSSSLFGNPDPWGTGSLPPALQTGSIPFEFYFDTTQEFEYTTGELPDIPKLPFSIIVVFDTYDTSNAKDGTSDTLSGISTVFYPYHEYAGWASPDGGFVVAATGSTIVPNALVVGLLSCIYLICFFVW